MRREEMVERAAKVDLVNGFGEGSPIAGRQQPEAVTP